MSSAKVRNHTLCQKIYQGILFLPDLNQYEVQNKEGLEINRKKVAFNTYLKRNLSGNFLIPESPKPMLNRKVKQVGIVQPLKQISQHKPNEKRITQFLIKKM